MRTYTQDTLTHSRVAHSKVAQSFRTQCIGPFDNGYVFLLPSDSANFQWITAYTLNNKWLEIIWLNWETNSYKNKVLL